MIRFGVIIGTDHVSRTVVYDGAKQITDAPECRAYDPYEALYFLTRAVCHSCLKRHKVTGERFCATCKRAFLNRLERSGYLTDIRGCKHKRAFPAPYWDEGSAMWDNVEHEYERVGDD